jgi:endonuclease IV
MIYIGSHISSSKGYAAMGRQALKLGADTFAFFTRNPRGGSPSGKKFSTLSTELCIGKMWINF